MKKIKIMFEGIDSWSRPVFKDELGNRFGSVYILFNEHATEKDVLGKVTEEDLLFFGGSFDCEPMGNDVISTLEIKWSV